MIVGLPGKVIGVLEEDSKILEKISSHSVLLSSIAEVACGISTGANDAFSVKRSDIEAEGLEESTIYKLIGGRDIDSYSFKWDENYIIYTNKNSNIKALPNIERHLEKYKEKLSKKRETVKGTLPWWSLHWPRTKELFENHKIVMRQTADKIRATIDEEGYYALDSIIIVNLKQNSDVSYKYLLGIINSRVTNYIYRNLTQEKGRAFAQVKPKNVGKLYVPTMQDNERYQVELLVDDILQSRVTIKEGMDRIDSVLYKFYGFNQDEINMINEETM